MIIVSKLLYRPALNEELIISPFVLSNVDMITFLKNEKKKYSEESSHHTTGISFSSAFFYSLFIDF